MSNVFLRFPKVKAKVPYSKSWIYLAISEGRFPAPIKAFGGGRAALWLESEIDAWICQQVQLSRSSKQEQQDSNSRPAAPVTESCRTARFRKPALRLRPGLAAAESPAP
jgi:prophage regulatory protein